MPTAGVRNPPPTDESPKVVCRVAADRGGSRQVEEPIVFLGKCFLQLRSRRFPRRRRFLRAGPSAQVLRSRLPLHGQSCDHHGHALLHLDANELSSGLLLLMVENPNEPTDCVAGIWPQPEDQTKPPRSGERLRTPSTIETSTFSTRPESTLVDPRGEECQSGMVRTSDSSLLDRRLTGALPFFMKTKRLLPKALPLRRELVALIVPLHQAYVLKDLERRIDTRRIV